VTNLIIEFIKFTYFVFQ